jgi:tRNA A-37 threonylcarbamoyl transferase component Bud32
MSDLDSLNLPKSIGRYQVLRLLGSGAMGSVVLAEDPRIKRKVAIKLMKLDAVRTEADQHEYLARFQREAEVSGLLNHPGIVAIYDVGEVDGYGPFLAMEFVEGQPLDGIMKAVAPLTLKEKLRIAVGLAEALDHAHAKAIVHRDVKPGNVMVGEDGRPKLMDFGIAKREDAGLTQAGTFLGTPSYASPEQIKEGTVDNRSDIFSFGVLAFELMSGQSPFPGTSINTILYRIVNEPPVEIQPPVLGILPEGWRRIFGKVLAKQPGDRYATCTAFVRDLLDAVPELDKEDRRELIGSLRLRAEPPLPGVGSTDLPETLVESQPPRRAGWLWVSAVALVVLMGGTWFFLKGPRGTRLQIDSRPMGAKVYLNDLAVGATPLSQPLVPGDKLRLELKGHQTATYEFKSGEAPPAFELEPIIREETLDSLPQGATVVLDGKPLEGVTPLKVQWNQGLRHRLLLAKDNLHLQQDFAAGELPGGRVLQLREAPPSDAHQEPSPDPKAPGFVKLGGGFRVHLKADGKDLGELNPGSKVSLLPGVHKLDLSNALYFYRDTRAVSLLAGQTATLTVPPLATLTVETFPGTGKVFVDDQDAHIESDHSSVQVAVGRHIVTVRGPNSIKHQTVDVSGDRLVKFQL